MIMNYFINLMEIPCICLEVIFHCVIEILTHQQMCGFVEIPTQKTDNKNVNSFQY